MSEIFLVRHAQASFGTDNYDALSDIGWQQSRLLGKYFFSRNGEFDRIVSGTLNRHKETLEGMLVTVYRILDFLRGVTIENICLPLHRTNTTHLEHELLYDGRTALNIRRH